MLPNENNYKKDVDSWKKTIKSHFDTHSLSKDKKIQLEQMLLQRQLSPLKSISSINKGKLYFRTCKAILLKNQKYILTHCVAASAAALLTFSLLGGFENNHHDILSEMAFLPDAGTLPADFDLVGDATALPQLSLESLPNQSFEPVIPKKITQKYTANEGRFFYLKGQQGVSISMQPIAGLPHATSNIHMDRPSTLYIVKLSQKNESDFPKKRILRKIISSTGKVRRIYAWQDGAYGYAMVQPQNISDGGSSSDIFQTSEDPSIVNP
ncbi:hypothetical protein [Fluviispira multicolorata]|uniref:Uncharacterized protein n=1 Tax=Fluviispira multicolorata TaxID=2654512 RepID=A0A833N102_9BACT|nr:hypothetical protein [Fluviispira multicolorata]KAB8029790.1 hypothetical protein GCL57_09625 [Fluviispira multicolorata]